MFQITIIDKTLAKMISPPKFLLEILGELNLLISNLYIKPDLIEDIHEFFPSLLITSLSKKAEIKRYSIPKRVQTLIDQAESNQLSIQEKSYLSSIKNYASRNAGISPIQFNLLRKMVKFPLEKVQNMVNSIKDHSQLKIKERKVIEKLTVFNNLKLSDAINKIWNRLKDKLELEIEYDDFTIIKATVIHDPTTYDRFKALMIRKGRWPI